MSVFSKEQKALERYIGVDLLELFRVSKAIIAGGAITSIFTQKEINDLDVYFRSFEDMEVFIRNAYREMGNLAISFDAELCDYQMMCVSQTARSLLFTTGDVKVQLIHFKFFENVQDIFDSFDYTINMGAFDFSTSQFVFDDRFLVDVAKRRLEFNSKTAYPIISTLRVSKYTSRGYAISKKTMFQIALAVQNLNIQSWEELEDQLSGFYGVDVSELFDKTTEFSIPAAIEMLDKVEEDFDHQVELTHPTFQEVMSKLRQQYNIEQPNRFFKKVNFKDGKIHSVVYKSFEWSLDSHNDGGSHGLYAFESYDEAESYHYDGNAVIEISLAGDNVVDYRGNEINITGKVKIETLRMISGEPKKSFSEMVQATPVPFLSL